MAHIVAVDMRHLPFVTPQPGIDAVVPAFCIPEMTYIANAYVELVTDFTKMYRVSDD